MAIYDLMFAKINGELLVENTEADITIEENIAEVDTIAGGHAGITPGVPKVRVMIKSAVPITGQEFDFATMMINHEPFEFQMALGGSGQTCTIPNMQVIGPVKLTSQVGKATEQDVTLLGPAPNPVWI